MCGYVDKMKGIIVDDVCGYFDKGIGIIVIATMANGQFFCAVLWGLGDIYSSSYFFLILPNMCGVYVWQHAGSKYDSVQGPALALYPGYLQ